MDEGGRSDRDTSYDRLLALNTALRLRRALHSGHIPAPRSSPEGPRDGDQRLLKESLDVVVPEAADLVNHFYAVLFHGRPYLRDLFPVAMDTQRDRLLHALLAVVGRLDQPEFEEAWLRAYTFAVEVMTAAADAAGRTPPYWHATVVSHEQRLDDLAVLTVRPDSPYDYEPGQFATLESPLRPRTWRPFSMATAPAEHGLLEFHVRMVGAGWVSRVLVRRTGPGDVLRLGPPVGDMTLGAASPDRDLLLIGGGTGLAPMKALLDGLSTSDSRRVTVLVAARGPEDLYDLDALSAMVARRPAVTLIVAMQRYAQRPLPGTVAAALPGQADEVARQLGDLRGREIFVAGPPAMLHACLTTFGDLGVPSDQVHFDVLGE